MIGEIVTDAKPTGAAGGAKAEAADDGPPKALNPKSWVTLPLQV